MYHNLAKNFRIVAVNPFLKDLHPAYLSISGKSSACKPNGGKKDSSLDPKLLELLNKQINAEYTAAYAYTALWSYFDRPSVGLSGFSKFHKSLWDEEKRHAKSLIKLINSRGGTVTLSPIEPPKQQEWKTPLDALKFSLEVEETGGKILQEAQKMAAELKDFHVASFLQSEIAAEELRTMNKLIKYISQLEGGNPAYQVDMNLKN